MPPLVLFPLEIALLSRKGCDFRLLLLVKSGVIQCVPVTKDPLKFLFPVLLNVHASVCTIAYMCGCTQRPEATPSVIFHDATCLVRDKVSHWPTVHLAEPP